jgi:hypothetical protein
LGESGVPSSGLSVVGLAVADGLGVAVMVGVLLGVGVAVVVGVGVAVGVGLGVAVGCCSSSSTRVSAVTRSSPSV